jgi:uncharacterized membrane protein YoaK (UPF0700 family)
MTCQAPATIVPIDSPAVLSVTAYSLRQKARLAISLAWIGGFIDAVGFLALAHVFVSNMTGNTAAFAMRVTKADPYGTVLRVAWPILMFFLGSVLSGVLTEWGRRRKWRSVYSIALSIEVALLVGFIYCRQAFATIDGWHFYALVSLPTLAMGLQNATITQIAGAVVRTTHVTGVLTDLGLEAVNLTFWFRDRTRRSRLLLRLRRAFVLSQRHPSFPRLFLLLSIWSSFLLGAILGAWGFQKYDARAVLAPVSFLMFLITLDLLRPIAAIAAVDHAKHDHELKRFGIEPGILPATVGVYRVGGENGRRQRAPDLGKLAESIASDHRVILLILSPGVDVDHNNLIGLLGSLRSLRERGRDLVLCVTEPPLFLAVRDGALGDELGEANLCSDPEFAVARAIEQSAPA